jgi:polar amino acid transport system substrate-binding protein
MRREMNYRRFRDGLKRVRRFATLGCIAALGAAGAASALYAQSETETSTAAVVPSLGVTEPLPFFWNRGGHLEAPDLSSINGINFLTDSDYPPFNYRDARGDLVGFNVDLAKALCAALRVRCRIAARDWDSLIPALEDRSADAVIASLSITEANRRSVDFSFPYFRSPARFAVRQTDDIETVTPEALSDKKIAVRADSAHAAYLRAFFGGAEITAYDTDEAAREAMRTGEVDAVFSDATSLMFWINGTASKGCCRFADGAFTESLYFGLGAGIAVRPGDQALIDALNYGLDRIKISGTYDRIYRKHFPLDLY